MVTFTKGDYEKYNTLYPLKREKELDEDIETHQYHDKIFKELLDDKTEFVNFMKNFFGYNIKERDVEKYNRKFITELGFKVRESDIIYKIKNKETFILIEIQSTINYRMPERMTEYCICIINSRANKQSKFRKAPIVFPVVLSVANKKWDASFTVVQEQDEYYGFPPLEYPKYNLVDAQKLTDEELLKDRMGISLALIIEKNKTKEEMKKLLDFVNERGTNEYEERCLWLIYDYSNKMKKLFGEEFIIYKEKIKEEKGEEKMEAFEEYIIDLVKTKEEEGISQGIMQVAKEMVKNRMKDEDILKVTHISKKELEELKKLEFQTI